MFTIDLFRKSAVAGVILSAVGLSGCGQPMVSGQAQIDGRSQAATTLGTLTTVSGTYTGCISSTGTWTASFGSGTGPSVVQGDTACQLHITQVSDGTNNYAPAMPMPVLSSGNFNGMAMQFSAGSTVFYADAMMLPANFAANFMIDFYHSVSPSNMPKTVSSQYQMVVGSVAANAVPVPSYALNFPSSPYLEDASNQILSFSSTAPALALNMNGQVAEDYAIAAGACPADPQSVYPMSPAPIGTALTYADFGLNVGDTVSAASPVAQCLMVRHCDATATSVCSFLTFELTFN